MARLNENSLKADDRWHPGRVAQPNGFQPYAKAQAEASETGRP
ncbi:unnamed protein product [marine sediment metagenome]|uniref:Uncharacterized protein n=1 Tax=marine sediment metagenome TaxID=412755 RepID=X1CU67_9ZZZZ